MVLHPVSDLSICEQLASQGDNAKPRLHSQPCKGPLSLIQWKWVSQIQCHIWTLLGSGGWLPPTVPPSWKRVYYFNPECKGSLMDSMFKGMNKSSKGGAMHLCTIRLFFSNFKTDAASGLMHLCFVFGVIVLCKGDTHIPSFGFISPTLIWISSYHSPSDLVCSFITFFRMSWVIFPF